MQIIDTCLKVFLHPGLEDSPGQEPAGGNNENENYRFIFTRVSFCTLKSKLAIFHIALNRARGLTETPTEACSEDIFLLCAFAGGQIISQAEFPVAVIAAQRPIVAGPSIQGVTEIVRSGSATKGMEQVIGRRGLRFGGVKRDNSTIGETGTFAERCGGYFHLGTCQRVDCR